MQFTRFGTYYRVSRITGPTHNLLGIEFGQDANSADTFVEILHVAGDSESRLSIDDVRQKVLQGVKEANEQLGTSYVVTRMQFVSGDSPPADIYRLLARSIAERLAKGEPFA
jgi:hypothetical protein